MRLSPRAIARRASLATRVTMLAALAVGLSVAIVATAGYFTVRSALYSGVNDSLYRRALGLQEIPIDESNISRLPDWALGAADVRIGIAYADGRPTLTPDRSAPDDRIVLGGNEVAVASGASDRSARTVSTSSGTQFRVIAVRGPRAGTALILAQSLEPTRRTLGRLGWVLGFFGGLGVLTSSFAGWAVARQGLRPVRRLTSQVERIAETERLEPIDIDGNDELARLGHAFNHMLISLAASRDLQRQLVADAGHELRTPLTSLRTNLDLLVQAEHRGGLPANAKAELLDDVRFQIAELTTLIGDLTELARDQGSSSAPEVVDFLDVVSHALDRVRRRATGQVFDVDLQPWTLVGDAASLERAVTNLLDNAVKWSPSQGTIGVSLRHGHLTVTDQGPGIPESDLPHIFDRFYRSAESRTLPGSGLGLAIVQQVAQRHSGTVGVAHTGPQGTTFVLSLPGEVGMALAATS